jgi:hypothetical protein
VVAPELWGRATSEGVSRSEFDWSPNTGWGALIVPKVDLDRLVTGPRVKASGYVQFDKDSLDRLFGEEELVPRATAN